MFPHLRWQSLRTTIAGPIIRWRVPFLCTRRTREVTTPCKSHTHIRHRAPRCQCQIRPLPRRILQTDSLKKLGRSVPGSPMCHTQETQRDTRLSRAKASRGSLEGVWPGRAAATSHRAKSTHRVDRMLAKALGIWLPSCLTEYSPLKALRVL